MKKGLGKSYPLPLRIAQSGGNAKPKESSPLSGVGGVSALGPDCIMSSEMFFSTKLALVFEPIGSLQDSLVEPV